MAGLALGALGRLISQRKSWNALGNATATATASTPSETGLSTAATSSNTGQSHGLATSSTEAQDPGETIGRQGAPQYRPAGPQKPPEYNTTTQAGVEARRSARNARINDPTSNAPAPGMSATQIGDEAIRRSRILNQQQQARVSNAALT